MGRMIYRGGQGMGTIPGGPLGKARYALSNGHADEAERIVRKRLERSPDDTSARVLLAQALLQQGQAAAAHLMRALILLSDKDPEGAIQAADTALRYDRTMAQAEFIKANALLESRRYDESLAALDSAERSNPLLLTGANAHSLRGRIYYKQRQFKKAYTQFLQTQLLNSRLRPLAPVLAGVHNVVVGQLRPHAQFALGFLPLAALF